MKYENTKRKKENEKNIQRIRKNNEKKKDKGMNLEDG
jgi:hypothetical protein